MEHAAADRHHSGAAAPLVHPLVPDSPATIVADEGALRALLGHLEDHPVLSYDTEFIGEESFFPKVCLVQVATAERIALVDPAGLGPRSPALGDLYRALVARGRTVLVHAGEADLGILRRGADAEPEAVVDTQIAAAMCWMPWPASLGTVLETLTGHRLGKAHTFTNWDARPLTAAQLRYAADDVRYLRLIWHLLGERLRTLGRLEWALAESREQLRAADFTPEAQLRRLSRVEPMRAGQRAVARELVGLRYQLARTLDLPARTVLPDATVVDLCKRKPATRAALGMISGVPRRILAAHGDEILQAIERGRSATHEPEPGPQPMDEPRIRAESDALWTAFQVRAHAIGLAPNLVATRNAFTRWFNAHVLARNEGRMLGAGDGPDALLPPDDWRHAAMGQWLDAFLRGGERLELAWTAHGMVAPGYDRPR
jgi:ribonuclease D